MKPSAAGLLRVLRVAEQGPLGLNPSSEAESLPLRYIAVEGVRVSADKAYRNAR